MVIKQKSLSLDIVTLEFLLKEASKNYKETTKNYKKTNKIFEKTDCTEAMHASEHWQETVSWLNDKIKKQKKLIGI